MLWKDWFNYMSTLLLSGAGGMDAKEGEQPQDGDLIFSLCPCLAKTSEGTIPAERENKRILDLYGNEADDAYGSMPSLRTIAQDETEFKLFTRDGPQNGSRVYSNDLTSLMESGFKISRPTVVATHGFLSNDHTEWMMDLKTAQLQTLDCNFISIDWSKCANNCCYFGARDCALIAGGYLEELLKTLIAEGADPRQFHLMGHSLGAHLVSQVSNNGLKVGRITGFDPPRWGFHWNNKTDRLDPDDAIQVDVIHSSSTLGWNQVLGQWDFFPNSAGVQPGCSIFNAACSHSMSYYYYIQTLYHNDKYAATHCDTLELALDGKCNGSMGFMGVRSTESAPGIYYVKVDEAATGRP